MANVKITELSSATTLGSTDVFPVVDVGSTQTKKITITDLLRNTPDGTAGAPSIANAGDQDTGIYFPAENNVGVSTGGTQRLVIDSSGRLLVGTTTEGHSSADDLTVSNTGGNCGITVRAGTTSSSSIFFSDGTSGDAEYRGQVQYSHSSDALLFATAASERLRISNSGNVGIGTTSPDDYLTIADTSTSGDIGLRFKGDASSRQFIMFGDPGGVQLGDIMYDHGTNALRFRTNNSEQMRIDSSGRVGIGTTSPDALLNLESTTSASLRIKNTQNSTPSVPHIELLNNNNQGLDITINRSGVDSRARFAADTAISVETGGSERLRIDSSGRLLVGTTTAGSMNGGTIVAGDQLATTGSVALTTAYTSTDTINIFGSAYSSANTVIGYAVRSDTTTFNKFLSTADNASWKRGALQVGGELIYSNAAAQNTAVGSEVTLSERLRIDNNGNVGIGTTSPNSYSGYTALTLNNATTGGLIDLEVNGTRTGTFLASATQVKLGSITSAFLRFDTNNTERMRITSGGGIGFGGGITIGNTTPTSNTAIYIGASVITSGAGNSTLKYNTSSGLVTYDTSSRLVKENITDCPYGIESVKQLQPRKYFRTDDQNEEIGFIADELVEVLPEFVPVGPKSLITKNKEDTEEIPLGVNYEKLTAVLTSALQEAIAKIETLEARLTALEGGS